MKKIERKVRIDYQLVHGNMDNFVPTMLLLRTSYIYLWESFSQLECDSLVVLARSPNTLRIDANSLNERISIDS